MGKEQPSRAPIDDHRQSGHKQTDIVIHELENSKNRLGEQQNTLRSFSKEAMKMVRLLILLVGVPIALFGTLGPDTWQKTIELLLSNDCIVSMGAVCLANRVFSIFSGAMVIFTMVLNVGAAGLEAHGVRNHTNPIDLSRILEDKFDDGSPYLRDRLEARKSRMRHNDQIISTMEKILAVSKATLVFAIMGSSTLAYGLVAQTPINSLLWALFLLLPVLVFGFISKNLPKDYIQQDSILNGGDLIYDRSEDYKSMVQEESD